MAKYITVRQAGQKTLYTKKWGYDASTFEIQAEIQVLVKKGFEIVAVYRGLDSVAFIYKR